LRLDYLNSAKERFALALRSASMQLGGAILCVVLDTCQFLYRTIMSGSFPGVVMRRVSLLLPFAFLVFVSSSTAQTPAIGTATVVWNALASPTMDPTKSARVENVEVVRDRVHITLKDGTIQFTQAVNGKITGASFRGTGFLHLVPPNPIEAQQLQLFTKQDTLGVSFSDATFSFTDALYDEIAKQVKWAAASPGDDLYAKRQQTREDLGESALPRMFEAVLSPDASRTGFFLADLKITDKGWIEVKYDSENPEEIRVGRWVDTGFVHEFDVWMSFPAENRDPRTAFEDPSIREIFLIPSYNISATAADNADLTASVRLTAMPLQSGERVLLFNLDSNLRVSSVKDGDGQPLDFFQARERKDRLQDYGDYIAVLLHAPTEKSRPQTLVFQYEGKRAIVKVGSGNYFCESFGWYPTLFEVLGVENESFRSDFQISFRCPKKYSLVATGHKMNETLDGNTRITEWKSDIPLPDAGFAYGDYKLSTQNVGDVAVEVYTNKQPDDLLSSIQSNFENPLGDLSGGPGSGAEMSEGAVGQLTPSALSKTITTETANTLRVFEAYFGPFPYKQLAVTNIVGSYGQGWPGLLYLSWITFLDSTQRHSIGERFGVNLDKPQLTDFFRAHESSHQWWGNLVGWKSYHDQWLSEGFAEFSGLLYVEYRENIRESLREMRDDKTLLLQKDPFGHRIDSLGPIWLGRRIASSVTSGGSYQNLIYSKGAYVLHMLRIQMEDPRSPDPDHLFKAMMQDYCKTYDNKPASTEDFKAIVEKHMTRGMDLDGNHKMDWFFNQYVYGTGVPEYSFHATLEPTPDGKTHIKGELVRTGVPDNWKDVVPVYAHIGDRALRLGTFGAVKSPQTVEFVLQAKIDRITINDFEDLLAEVKQ